MNSETKSELFLSSSNSLLSLVIIHVKTLPLWHPLPSSTSEYSFLFHVSHLQTWPPQVDLTVPWDHCVTYTLYLSSLISLMLLYLLYYLLLLLCYSIMIYFALLMHHCQLIFLFLIFPDSLILMFLEYMDFLMFWYTLFTPNSRTPLAL